MWKERGGQTCHRFFFQAFNFGQLTTIQVTKIKCILKLTYLSFSFCMASCWHRPPRLANQMHVMCRVFVENMVAWLCECCTVDVLQWCVESEASYHSLKRASYPMVEMKGSMMCCHVFPFPLPPGFTYCGWLENNMFQTYVEWHQQELILFSGIFPANKTGQDTQSKSKSTKNNTNHLSPKRSMGSLQLFLFFFRSPSPKFQRCPAWEKQSRCNVKRCIHSQHS